MSAPRRARRQVRRRPRVPRERVQTTHFAARADTAAPVPTVVSPGGNMEVVFAAVISVVAGSRVIYALAAFDARRLTYSIVFARFDIVDDDRESLDQ